MVQQINEQFDAPLEPIKVATFRDYTSRLTTTDVQDVVQWLSDHPLSVTGNKLGEQLRVLKTRRNIIWNVCHPKNTLVAQENSMFVGVFRCCYH